MARLSKDEWAEVRREWEASPQQGLTWLTKGAGGRFDVTEEAIRRQRLAAKGTPDEWVKRGRTADVARRAREGADRLTVASEFTPDPTPPETPQAAGGGTEVGESAPKKAPAASAPDSETAAVDLRAKLIDLHRNEWRAARRLVYAAMAEAEKAEGFEKAKFAKISTESLKNIQEGERRAWSLDADLIDFEALTDAQLEAYAAGKVPK